MKFSQQIWFKNLLQLETLQRYYKNNALYIHKERVQDLINQQRKALADVEYLDLNSIANVINEFENPSIEDINFL